ncbi:fused MFS/spermidine synthase [Kribbella jiaozuonensis]|uniref:Spermidine synthase n=1 Tax=Kribbella jiaozuonensis TaxID=2575441 RepID=A0A4U3LMM3_9ACTN|nr:fused MFS/spermidine synthase [Kribbella jiaozuonensis]TKK76842.1 spermidine synthase [Kribbella jiaozuonensis]
MGKGEAGPVGQKLAIALAFGSSAAVMVLELVSLRLVAPYIGLTLETNTAVIGVALAAIATGAALGGKFADVVPPQRTLGPLLLFGGALVMLILPVVRWTGQALANDMVFLVLAVTLFAPASLLAAVTPMVTKLRLSTLEQTGTVVGRLSAYATVGGIVGTVLTGFVFVATVPISTIILTLGAALVVAGAALTFLLRGVQAAMKPVALAVIGATLTVVAPRPCEVETAYHCARVVADPGREGGRTLYLDQLRHSYVDLDDPTYLEFEYIKNFAAAINGSWPAEKPLDVLHVGGGGLTMPRYLTATRPGSKHQVYEIDPAVVELDKKELGVRTGPDLAVTVKDGRLGVRDEATDSRDLVIMDAFSGQSVPWHLTTRELITDVRRVLRPGGIYLINVIDHGPARFAKAEVKTLQAVFPYVGEIVRTNGSGGNFVLIASDRPLDVPAISSRLEPGMKFLDQPTSDGPVLTDDFAPVDQLLTPYGQ